MSAADPGQASDELPQGVSFEDATKISQGDVAAIAALVARFKANKILPLQLEFIAFFAALPEDAWLALRQAMIDARVPIRDIDKKVKAKREENARPSFVPSDIDDANSYGLFTMTKDGLFKALKQAQIRICVPFEVVGLMRRARDPGEPKAGATGWSILLSFRDGDGHEITASVETSELHRKPSEVCAKLADVGMSIMPGRVEQQAFAEYLIGHPSKKRAWRLAQRGWAKVDGQMIYATRRKIFSAEPLKGLVILADKVDGALRPHGDLDGLEERACHASQNRTDSLALPSRQRWRARCSILAALKAAELISAARAARARPLFQCSRCRSMATPQTLDPA